MKKIFSVENVDFYYGDKRALKSINLEIGEKKATAFIGPSGCGKTTLLRCLNRMNDLVLNTRVTGQIMLDGKNIYDPAMDVINLRRRVGMIFQKWNPFPKSIYENIIYGLRIVGINNRAYLDEVVEKSLRRAALWDEVKDNLHKSAADLSGGQQQRLCIARALAVEPEVLLMDEPCSALDPISTAKIEELIHELKDAFTIVIVTHNMQQAARVSDYTAFFYLGELIEFGETGKLFTASGEAPNRRLHHRPFRLRRNLCPRRRNIPIKDTEKNLRSFAKRSFTWAASSKIRFRRR